MKIYLDQLLGDEGVRARKELIVPRKRLAREDTGRYNGDMPVAACKSQAPQTSAQVLDFLRGSPGQTHSPKEIADALGLVAGRVSASLQYLNRQHPEVVNEGRGRWSWREVSPQPSASKVELLAPLAKALGGASMTTAALPEATPALFEPVTTHRSGATVLRDSNGELWLAQPIRIDVWPSLMALGFEPEEDKSNHNHR